MSHWEPLVFFYKRSKRPFYFPKKKPRFIRFSGQAFAFDYNFIGRFFYVLLEVGLKNQAAYKVPNFLQKTEALFSGRKLPYLQEDVFLFRPSYFFFALFSQGTMLGYFPISFYNSVFLNGGYSKHSFVHQFLWRKRSLFKSTMQRVLVDVDSHLSLLFSGKAVFFPKANSYIATFKYALGQVYLISGDHNVSSYTWRAEGSSFKFGAVSFRRYRDLFFKFFFRGLRFYFFSQLFSFCQGPSVRSREVLDFCFDYFYRAVFRVFQYFCYLKLFLGSFVFFWFRFFISLKRFLAELFYSVAQLAKLPFSFALFSKLFFFRKLFLIAVRSFLASGVFRALLWPMASPALGRQRKALVTTDLAFFRGLGLHSGFSGSLYREFIFKFPSKENGAGARGKFLGCWVDTLRNLDQRKRSRWIDYLFGYYRKKRKRALFARKFGKMCRKVFPNYIYTFYKPSLRYSRAAAFSLASLSFKKCFRLSEKAYGRRLFPFFPCGHSFVGYRSHLSTYVVSLFAENSNNPRRLFKKNSKTSKPLRSVVLHSSLGSFSKRQKPFFSSVYLPLLKGRVFRALNAQILKHPWDSKLKGRSSFGLLSDAPRYVNIRSLRVLLNAQALKKPRVKKLSIRLLKAPVRWGFRFRRHASSFAPQHFRWYALGAGTKNFLVNPAFRKGAQVPKRPPFVFRKGAQVPKRPPFVFLKQTFVRFLMFFFGPVLAHLRELFSRPVYRMRRAIFFKLRRILLKHKSGFLLGRSRFFKSTFTLPLGILYKKTLRRKVSRRRKKMRKFLPRKGAFLKSYKFSSFFSISLFPLVSYKLRFLKPLAFFFFPYYSASKWVLFGHALVSNAWVPTGLSLRMYFLFVFSRFIFLVRRVVSFLFYFFDAFAWRYTPPRSFLQNPIVSRIVRCHIHFALKIFFFFEGVPGNLVKLYRSPKGRFFKGNAGGGLAGHRKVAGSVKGYRSPSSKKFSKSPRVF